MTKILAHKLDSLPSIVRPYVIGRDLTQTPSEKYVIDFTGLSEANARSSFPNEMQIVIDRVKPQRVAKAGGNADVSKYAEQWWLFAKTRSTFRQAFASVESYIGTCRTSRHRTFTRLGSETLPDAKVVAIAVEDSWVLGILSSRIHTTWAERAGGRLGVGNDPTYNHADCFNKFPFADVSETQKKLIGSLAHDLENHRKRQQALHPKLTMTGMYNVLEKLRAGEELTAKERTIHEQGLVSVLRQIHDDLDAAVAEAYGWPVDLADEEILERLVALNHQRAEEERRGLVRWLRPDYQNPDGQTQKQLPGAEQQAKPTKAARAKLTKQPWPKTLSQQAAAVQSALATLAAPADVRGVLACFKSAAKAQKQSREDRVAELLETLTTLGRARQLEDGRYVAG